MFQLATCNRYVALKHKYRDLFSGHGYEWSLKEFGCLFIYDQIEETGAKSVLEVGNGYNPSFSNILKDKSVSYACMDNPLGGKGIQAEADKVEALVSKITGNGHNYYRGLLGEKNAAVPDAAFDFIFSISVIEHIGDEDMAACVDDAWRLLKPGGVLANTIDIYQGSKKHKLWHNAALERGFSVEKPYTEHWEFRGNNTTFVERPDIRYLVYQQRRSRDPIADNLPYLSHFATCIHCAVKPAA